MAQKLNLKQQSIAPVTYYHGSGTSTLLDRTNESFGTAPQMPSWTFTNTEEKLLDVSASITCRQENSAGAVDTEYAIYVDSDLVTRGSAYFRTNYDGVVVALNALVEVPAGTHTVTIQYRKSYPGSVNFRIYGTSTYLTCRLIDLP